jgi:hypothetical protein
MKRVTPASLQAMLNNPNREHVSKVIGRALVVLLNNQTRDEQAMNATTKSNGIGFTGADAKSGSITAKYFIKHNTLLDWQIDRWTKPSASGFSRLTKYHKQLNAAAEEKASKKIA